MCDVATYGACIIHGNAAHAPYVAKPAPGVMVPSFAPGPREITLLLVMQQFDLTPGGILHCLSRQMDINTVVAVSE